MKREVSNLCLGKLDNFSDERLNTFLSAGLTLKEGESAWKKIGDFWSCDDIKMVVTE